MEEGLRESSTPQQQDDLDVSRGTTSLLPVVDLSDDPERRTQLRYSSYHGRILSSLSRTAPNLTAPHKNTQPLRRNPNRLARPASSIGIPQTRRRSTSPIQESTINQERSPSPISEDEENNQRSTSPILGIRSSRIEQAEQELPSPSPEREFFFNQEKERKVAFHPTDYRSNNYEDPPSSLPQRKPREELSPSRTRSEKVSDSFSKRNGYRKQEEGQDAQEDGLRISKDFMSQLCRAFKVENLNELQRILPYQPSLPQPLLSHAKQHTYYENDLSYIAAASGDSASESSDQETLANSRVPTINQASKYKNRRGTNTRALLSQQEKPLRGKWIPPTHIPPLDESISDYDVWFHQMHQYLLQSCITNAADQRFLTQLHCDWDFFEAIVTRAKEMNIPKETLCGSRRIFRDFVCTYYTRPEAFHDVQDELRKLGKRDLSVKEVWQELRRLFMSHDAKAKRQGYPELTNQQKVEYLIDGLRPRVQFLMSWLRRQRHPDLAIPSTAYAATLLCEKDLQKLDSTGGDLGSDLAWFTPADVRERVRLPLLSQQSNKQAHRREAGSKTEGASNMIRRVPQKENNSRLNEKIGQSSLNSSSVNRQKRPLDSLDRRETMICAFCLNKGHIASNCRKRRRALELQLKGQDVHYQRIYDPRRNTAMTALSTQSQSLSSG